MKDTIASIITLIILFCSLLYLAFLFGENNRQREIEKRALRTNCCQECNEIIIFGEKQI